MHAGHHRVRQPPPGPRLAVVVALFCTLGVLYSAVVPLFEAPDEIWHFGFIQVLADRRALPVQPTEGKDMWLREAGQPPLYHILAAPLVAALDTSDFPNFVRFNLAHPAVTAGSDSKAPNIFIHTPHEAFPYRGSVLAVHLVRLLSLMWGAGAVVGAYAIAREVRPERTDLAVGAAAVAALNPHWIFISSVVNNDATAACLCTLTLWSAICLVKRAGDGGYTSTTARLAHAALLGLLLGLSLLSKLSALALLPLVAVALGLAWWRERDLQATLLRGGILLGVAALVAGWWYVRNWQLYGDPLGWRVWLIDIGVRRIGLPELLRQFGHVATSYWSPYDGLLAEWVFWGLGLLLVVAIAGWMRLIVRSRERDRDDTKALLLAGTWFVLLFTSLIRYMTTTPSAEGRLLFPGIASASLLLVLGWEAAIPRGWQRGAAQTAGAGLLALCIATPLFAIGPRYALPRVTRARELEGLAPVAGGNWQDARLLGVRVAPKVVQPGKPVEVALYWEALSSPVADLQAVVRLWTAGGRLLGQWDGTPAGTSYPPDLWHAGEVIRDAHRLEAIEGGPALYRVATSVRRNGQELDEASSAAAFKLAPRPLSAEEQKASAPKVPLSYTLGDVAMLTGYSLPTNLSLSADGLPVSLYWRSLSTTSENYTVFVHLLDANGRLIGQGDGEPLNGDYPTSGWSPGEELVDVHTLLPKGNAPVAEAPPGASLMVGLYRLSDGVRLPALTETGERVAHDAIRLALPE